MVKPTEAPNPHWYEVARDEFKAAIAEGAEQYRAAATECLGEAYIKLKNFPEARSNFSKLEGIVEDGEQVGVAKWRRADAIRLSHDDDGSGHIASAAGLMNAALETLGAPKSGDRRGLYRLARMHDCHCRIRMKMHNAANATRDSYKAAELNYDAVIKLIDPERLTAWSRWTMQWSDYWHGHRTAELLTQAKNHSGRLKTDYNKHLQRNDTSSSGTDPEKQASEGSDSGDRSHEEPGTES